MIHYIEVISPGLYTSIQDLGRIGFRKYGVPASGAMDRQSATLANHLLNNPLDAAVIEITLSGPKLLFSASTLICITGADMSPSLNDKPFSMNKPIIINQGDLVSFGALKFGARCYMAVKGGLQTEIIMNSRSYYHPVTLKSQIGKGDRLNVTNHTKDVSFFATFKPDDSAFHKQQISCIPGPEFDLVAQEENLIFNSVFTISRENNRMGYRLEGHAVSYPSNFSMLTSAVLPGTVQLTPSGQLIILMRDCQTTGGYPRILQVTAESINHLAQKKARDTFNFKNMNVH